MQQGETMMPKSTGFIRVLAIALGLLAFVPATRATTLEVVQIAATTLIQQNTNTTTNAAQVLDGLMTAGNGNYFASVQFPVDDVRVCKFTLVHHDNDSQFNITAHLMKKPVALGGVNAFSSPVTMATVTTSGASNNELAASTTAITQPEVQLAKGFFYVQVTLPATTLEVIGLQVYYTTHKKC